MINRLIEQRPLCTKRNLLIFGLLMMTMLSSFMSGFFFYASVIAPQREFPILSQAYKILIDHAYYPLPDIKTLEYAMIRGMLQEYHDPYASFLEPTTNELETDRFEGSFGGIGADILQDTDGNFIIYPFPGSPASRVGIKEGDRLLGVDDIVLTKDSSLESIQALIRGPVGSRVLLTIGHAPVYEPVRLSVFREEIKLPSVIFRSMAENPSVGYIKVNIIASSTPDEIIRAFNDLAKNGVNRYILDLRDNGGGLLTAGVEVARLFLSSGEIIRQEHPNDDIEIFRVIQPGPLADSKLAVLINHNTASAAEIIAGALQMHARAKLIGEPSYGKNTIQLVFSLDDGSSLHLTAARWWFPGGSSESIENGIEPDIYLASDNYTPEEVLDYAVGIITQE